MFPGAEVGERVVEEGEYTNCQIQEQSWAIAQRYKSVLFKKLLNRGGNCSG